MTASLTVKQHGDNLDGTRELLRSVLKSTLAPHLHVNVDMQIKHLEKFIRQVQEDARDHNPS